jgi:hypothetical protein
MIFCAFVGEWMVPDFAGPMKTLSKRAGKLVFPVSVSMKELWLMTRTTQATTLHRKKSGPVQGRLINLTLSILS